MLSKIFLFVKEYKKDIILIVGVILISLFSFAVGYIASDIKDKEPIIIENIL